MSRPKIPSTTPPTTTTHTVSHLLPSSPPHLPMPVNESLPTAMANLSLSTSLRAQEDNVS
jgi:hypothetical protein